MKQRYMSKFVKGVRLCMSKPVCFSFIDVIRKLKILHSEADMVLRWTQVEAAHTMHSFHT